jgi:hypothetical protein
MGKRELLLIAAFALVGIVVYQVTAPPPGPGERSFSFRQILENVRRGVRGNRASAVTTATTTYPADQGLNEFRLNLRNGDITITGEDRSDIEAELHVQSNGFDEAEAARLAKATTLQVDRAGSSLNASINYPAEGRQRASIILKIPARLRVRLDPNIGLLTITNVAALEVTTARGDTQIRRVVGRVTAQHNGGKLRVSDVGPLKLTTRGSDVELDKVKGEATIGTRAGDLKAIDLSGPIDVESNGTDLTLDSLANTTGTLRVNAVNGSVSIKGLRTDGRIDARNAEVRVIIDRAAPLAIYSEGGESVELTPPPGGYQLDAIATDGRLTLPDGTLEVTTSGQQHRATGAVRGGGATITIRSSRGDITVRPR